MQGKNAACGSRWVLKSLTRRCCPLQLHTDRVKVKAAKSLGKQLEVRIESTLCARQIERNSQKAGTGNTIEIKLHDSGANNRPNPPPDSIKALTYAHCIVALGKEQRKILFILSQTNLYHHYKVVPCVSFFGQMI